MKIWLLRLLALVSLAAACGAFYGLPTAKVLVIQPAPTFVFLAVLAATPLVGRLFCGWLCPLGVLQSAVHAAAHPKSHVRRVCTRLPVTRAQIAMRGGVFALFALLVACGAGALAWAVTPYSILGKALVGFAPGLVLLGVVLALALVGRGRVWCNWICPVGSCFTLLARRTLRPHRIDLKAGCGACRACFAGGGAQKKAAEADGKAAPAAPDGVTRRALMSGVGLLAAAEVVEKTVDGGFAPVSLPGVPARPAEVLPPGAADRPLFNRLCVGCGLCMAACPEKCLVPSTALGTFGQPKMDFRRSHCRLACPQKCAAACPAGALVLRRDVARRDLHMGHAIWKKDRCLRTTEGVPCTACSRKCPVQAIVLVKDVPVVDKDKCIGCGACEHVCPARPQPAIFVKGFERQRLVKPFDEGELVAEMKGLLLRGEAASVAAVDGAIVAHEQGRGVQPLLKLLDAGRLRRALVVDKVIGRAAAGVCLAGRVRKVHALVMGEDAAAFLHAHGVLATADKTVPRILNRAQTAPCPLEARVEKLDDPAQIVEAVRSFTPPAGTRAP